MANKYFKHSDFLTKFGSRDSWADYARACVNGRHDFNILDDNGSAFLLLDRNFDNENITTVRTYRLYANAPTLGYSMINSDISNQSPFPMVDTTISGTIEIETTRPLGQWTPIYSFTYSKFRNDLNGWNYEKTGATLPRDLDGSVWFDISQLPYYFSDDANLYEKVKKYVDNGDYSDAENASDLDEKLFAEWTIGYTNSNDTVYSLAVNCPSFHNQNSKFFGKNDVASVYLKIQYVIGETLVSIYENTYTYGTTWTGKLSSIIGDSDLPVAQQLANKIASVLDLDRITLSFEVRLPDGVLTSYGRVVFDHSNLIEYLFPEYESTTTPQGDRFIFKQGVVLSDNDSDISNPDDEESESDTETETETSEITGTGLLTRTYVLTPQEIQGIGAFLWGASFIQNIRLLNNSPIENIVSCKLFPFNLSGESGNVVIGNVDTETEGQIASKNVVKYESNVITIPKYFIHKADNLAFLDYAPYTKVEIFLPFIGIKELPTDICMGKRLKLKWWIDLVCGTVETNVYIEDIENSNNFHCIYIFNSQCGVDIPLTAQNLSQVQSAYIQNAISGGISLASGNISGVASSINGAINTQYHTQTSGTPAPATALQANLNPYVRIIRPKIQYLGTVNANSPNEEKCKMYKHLNGVPCYEVKNLGECVGYTEVENPQIEIDGALSKEVDEVLRLLSQGVILQSPIGSL